MATESSRTSDPETTTTTQVNLQHLCLELRRSLIFETSSTRQFSVPRVSTRSSLSRHIYDQLSSDLTTFSVKSVEERENSRRRLQKMASENRKLWTETQLSSTTQGSDTAYHQGGNIRVRNHVGPLRVPRRITQQRRDELRRAALEIQKSAEALKEPYRFGLGATLYESAIPMVKGHVHLELLDGEIDESSSCLLQGISMICDTGAHFSVITDDLLPQAFLDSARNEGYRSTYGRGADHDDGMFIQANMDIQFSNEVETVDSIIQIRRAGTLPNNFSGIILGQHSFLDGLDFQMVSRKVLEARGEDLGGLWGEIVLGGRVIDGEYFKLGK